MGRNPWSQSKMMFFKPYSFTYHHTLKLPVYYLTILVKPYYWLTTINLFSKVKLKRLRNDQIFKTSKSTQYFVHIWPVPVGLHEMRAIEISCEQSLWRLKLTDYKATKWYTAYKQYNSLVLDIIHLPGEKQNIILTFGWQAGVNFQLWSPSNIM